MPYNFFVPRPPPFLFDPGEQGDPDFSGLFPPMVPAWGPIAPAYGGYVQAPQFLQGRAPGETGVVGPQREAIQRWYENTNAGTPTRQANIYGLPFQIAQWMARSGAPYAGMAAPLPLGEATVRSINGANSVMSQAAPFNPLATLRATGFNPEATVPSYNPLAGYAPTGNPLNFNPGASASYYNPTANYDPRPPGQDFRERFMGAASMPFNPIPQNLGPSQSPRVTASPTTGFTIPETRQPSSSMYPWQSLSGQVGVAPQGTAGGAPQQGGAFNPWWGVLGMLNSVTAGNAIANALQGGNAPATQPATQTPTAAALGAGAAGYGNVNNFAPRSTGTTSKTGTGTKTAPFGTGMNNNLLGAGDNPNEPGKMAGQYNNPTIKQGTTGAGTGTTPRTVSPQGDSWVDANGYKHHKDYHINYAYQRLDGRLGQGFTDQFISRMGTDPIRFYLKEFVNDPRAAGWDLPDERGRGARDFLSNMAAYAAESDAKFHPGALADWRIRHGDVPPPPEQWAKWHKIAMATGGDPLNTGVGENPYGNY